MLRNRSSFRPGEQLVNQSGNRIQVTKIVMLGVCWPRHSDSDLIRFPDHCLRGRIVVWWIKQGACRSRQSGCRVMKYVVKPIMQFMPYFHIKVWDSRALNGDYSWRCSCKFQNKIELMIINEEPVLLIMNVYHAKKLFWCQ